MNKINISAIETITAQVHEGKGKANMKFAFTGLSEKGNWNFFGVVELPIGTTAESHKHDDKDEWFYILEGEATFIVDNISEIVKKGDFILMQAGQYHSIQNVTRKLKFLVAEIDSK